MALNLLFFKKFQAIRQFFCKSFFRSKQRDSTMLELVDPRQKVEKSIYRESFPQMEIKLAECQRGARAEGVPLIVVFEGWEAAGKGTLINSLAQTLDPRGFKVHPVLPPNDDERLRPWMWRFWNRLPAAGTIAIFDESWYRRVLGAWMEGSVDEETRRAAFADIMQFERQLADDGAVIVKFWLHIDRKEQKKRFKKLEKNPATAWKVGKFQKAQNRRYDEWTLAVEEALARTNAPHAPWTIVEATQKRFSRMKVFETLIRAIGSGLDRRSAPAQAPPATPAIGVPKSPVAAPTVLDRLDLSLTLDRSEYDVQLKALQKRLFQLEHELYLARIPAAIVFEGMDAAGKGGAIRRLTRGLDPRGYEVIPIGVPTAEEKARHYLWRFWRNVPKAGHIAIFDRSWYGRVLVERVEGFCSEEEWRRAYREIVEFESQLAEFGTVLVKFWLHIDLDEQLARFQAREATPYKQWKITEEDWRNRDKWPQYRAAVADMLQNTSAPNARWTVLEANCKLHARIKTLSTVAKALEKALDRG